MLHIFVQEPPKCWQGPLYSGSGCCGAWCVFGCKTMNASCGMDPPPCLIARLANNNHTNKVLFWGNFNHDTRLPPLHFDFVILQWAGLLSSLQSADDWPTVCYVARRWNALTDSHKERRIWRRAQGVLTSVCECGGVGEVCTAGLDPLILP